MKGTQIKRKVGRPKKEVTPNYEQKIKETVTTKSRIHNYPKHRRTNLNKVVGKAVTKETQQLIRKLTSVRNDIDQKIESLTNW